MKKRCLIVVICTLFLTGCSLPFLDNYDEYEIPEDVVITENENVFDVFSTVNTKDFVNVSNATILSDDVLEVNEIGTFDYTVELKYEKRTYKYNLKYEVKDVTAPVFISAASSRTVGLYDVLYPCNGIVYADDYDNLPTCEVDGEYDLTSVGSYPVEYVIKDASGNETRKDLTINVVEKLSSSSKSSSSSSTSKNQFSDVIANYKNDNTMIGIDVSKWQGNIDFDKVKAAGAEFVIMRIGVNNDIDKDIDIDSYYQQNIINAKTAGLKVGVYFYSTATTEEKAKEQAEWVVNTLDGITLDYPVAYDWENWSKFMNYQISLHDFNNCFYTFADVLSAHGYDTMLYSSKFYLNKIWENKYNYPVWLAHYTSQTDYTGEFMLWQMANTGRIDGINGDVDIDILYLDKYNQ